MWSLTSHNLLSYFFWRSYTLEKETLQSRKQLDIQLDLAPSLLYCEYTQKFQCLELIYWCLELILE